jgi:magnesium transporter
MRITVFENQTSREGSISELDALLKNEAVLLWVDITNCTDEEALILRDVFHFHPLAIEDTRNQRQRPKLEEYDNYVFLIINSVMMVESDDPNLSLLPGIDTVHDLEFREVNLFIGKRYVVTVHNEDETIIVEARRRIQNVVTSYPITVGYLTYTMLDTIVDRYFPIMDRLEEEIDALEDLILARPRQQHLNRLFELKHMLLHLWRVVWPERDLVSNLSQPHVVGFTDSSSQYYLRDVSDHLFWIADMIGTFRDSLTGLIDLYMSSVSNQLNRVVNRLTIMTLIIGVLTVVSGFYGMNFDHNWPPSDAPWSVPLVIIIMGLAIGAIYIVLQRINKRIW